MNKPTILLVDDDADILDYLSDELCKEYSVLKAGNGKAALTILNDDVVQLLISDVMMPLMDGFELCETVKKNIEFSHIPVILLTAKNTLQSKIEGLEMGADAYIEKPFSPRHLKAQITNLLANRHKVKEYFANLPLVHIKSMAYSKADEVFLGKLNEAINQNLSNLDLDVEQLANMINMSRPTLYRKVKAISNLTPSELITITRLKKAAELLIEDDYKIYEVSDLVGFSSQTQFGKSFHKQFAMTPKDYIASKRLKNLD